MLQRRARAQICAMDYTVTITPQSNETVTGTFCGDAVNLSS
jgi:hypothetical protein